MQLSVLAPVPHLPQYTALTNYHLSLAHLLLGDANYLDFHVGRRLQGAYILVDNSVIETGSPMTPEQLVTAQRAVNGHEVIVPDVMGDPAATIALARDSIKWLRQTLPDTKMMVVPQGDTVDAWMTCLDELMSVSPDVIGVPKSLGRAGGINARLDALRLIGKPFKTTEYHCLGIWNNPIELVLLSQVRWLRGVDSSIALQAAMAGVWFDPLTGWDRKGNFPMPYHRSLSRDERRAADHNVMCLLRWAAGFVGDVDWGI
jgi:hypothetical protein